MSNLLEKASILLTPTAYDDGKILSVKPVQSLGNELITNGDFATDSDWVKSGGVTISGGQANIVGDGTSFESITQYSIFTIGKKYKVSVDVTINSGLGLKFQDGANNENIGFATTSGTYVFYFTGTSGADFIVGRRTGGTAFNSSVNNVSIKEVIDGDFDFTRNSSATRVNSQGLIEDVQILSSNLVSNGDFSQEGSEQITNGDFSVSGTPDATSWALGWSSNTNNAEIANGKLTLSNSAAESVSRAYATNGVNSNNILTTNKFYKLQYDIVENNGATDLKYYSANAEFISVPSVDVGSYTLYIQNTGNSLFLFQLNTSNASVSIDNVSVKEVGQDWTLGTGVTVGENKAIFTSTASGQSVSQNAVASSLTNGALAKVSFEVLSRTQGSFGVYFSGTLVGTLASAGVFTGYFTKGTETSFYIRALGTTSGSISNISVIEITEDTNLPRINYEGFSYQDSLGSELVTNGDFSNGSTGWTIINGTVTDKYNASMTAYQSGIRIAPFSNTGTFKVVFDLVVTSGSCKFDAGGSNNAIYSTSGTKEIIVTNTTKFEFNAFNLGWVGTLDNVSVKEYLGQEVVPDSGCGSWLFEPQSTQTATYSNDFTQGDIFNGSGDPSVQDTVLTSQQTTSPDGTNNAWKLVDNNDGLTGRARFNYFSATVIANNYNTISYFVKKQGSNNFVYINTTGFDAGANGQTYFDIQNGTLGNVSANHTANIENYGNGWYRISITMQTVTDTQGAFSLILATSNGAGNILRDGTNGVYLFGVQAESDASRQFMTSYIPTSGSTVTRLQDAAFGAGSSDLINSTEGVLYAEIAALGAGTYKLISLNNGSAGNSVTIGFNNGSSNFYFRVASSNGTVTYQTFPIDYDGFNKIALKYKSGDISIFANGTKKAQSSGTFAFASSLNKLNFDYGSNDGLPFFGKNKCVAVFKEALTDAELTCLTTI